MTDTVKQRSQDGDRIVVDFDQHSHDYRVPGAGDRRRGLT
jgi:hypothetical protein